MNTFNVEMTLKFRKNIQLNARDKVHAIQIAEHLMKETNMYPLTDDDLVEIEASATSEDPAEGSDEAKDNADLDDSDSSQFGIHLFQGDNEIHIKMPVNVLVEKINDLLEHILESNSADKDEECRHCLPLNELVKMDKPMSPIEKKRRLAALQEQMELYLEDMEDVHEEESHITDCLYQISDAIYDLMG